jgi:hypothetical protein
MSPAYRGAWRSWLLAGVLITAFLLQLFLAGSVKSPVFDEPPHIAAGLSYLETGKFVANLQHPPLLKELAALSLLAAGVRWPDSPEARALVAGNAGLEWPIGNSIISANGPDRVMFWARLPFILLAALLGVLIYLWGRKLAGDAAALGALFLYVLDPTVVAHSFLVTTDAGFAAFTVLFFFALWTYLQSPSLKRLLFSGLALGLALGAKFSAVALLPVAALLFLAEARWPLKTGPRRTFFDLFKSGRAKHLNARERKRAASAPPAGLGKKLAASACAFLAMCVAAALVIDLLYFSSHGVSLYTAGFEKVNADHNPNYLAYMAGQLAHRFSAYFALAYLLKEPIAGIVLAAAGLVAVVRSKALALVEKLFLLLPPAALFAAYSISADDMGFRYLIPTLPFACLLGGIGLAALIREKIVWKRGLAAVLSLWIVVAAAGIFPDGLSYFNEAACLPGNAGLIGLDGGSRCGPLWLDDSNIDWGQGLKQLQTWLGRHALGQAFHLVYFGFFPPEAYGIPHDAIVGPEFLQGGPKPGMTIVSAHWVARAPALFDKVLPGSGDWLRKTPPNHIVGHTFYVYDTRGPNDF